MKNKIIRLILIIIFPFAFYCQHARLRIAAPLPKGCQIGENKKCEIEKIPLESKNPIKKTFEINQKYYFGGLFPRKYELNESSYCKDSGIYEILQYYTFKDALLEQLTAFIYSPRTVRITCY